MIHTQKEYSCGDVRDAHYRLEVMLSCFNGKVLSKEEVNPLVILKTSFKFGRSLDPGRVK
jgi:hypothetical protein